MAACCCRGAMCYFVGVIGYNMSSVVSIIYDCKYVNLTLYVSTSPSALPRSNYGSILLPCRSCCQVRLLGNLCCRLRQYK